MGLRGDCGGRFKASEGIHDGGWWLTRSVVVRWDNGHEAFFKANDEGAYDLYEIVPQENPQENNRNSDHNDHNRKRKFEEALQADILQKSAQ